jgi:uncharacterized iron-regulated protein
LSEASVIDRLDSAQYILLGETHDNPDHHLLQARFLQALIERGRRPVVAFEMIASTQRIALARHLARNPKDAAGLGAAIEWDQSGWPPWRLYQPIAEVALNGGSPIVTASFAPETVRRLARADPTLRRFIARLRLNEPLPVALQESLEREIVASHCGAIEGEAIERMARIQRIRDAAMARRLFNTATKFGAVLIAGAGHCRNDRGAPYYLHRINSGSDVLSLAFIEVSEGKLTPAEYASAFYQRVLPFDLVCFTPRIDIRDPCERFREQLEQIPRSGKDGADG